MTDHQANSEHIALLKKGVKRWNEWRKEHAGIQAALCEADLGGLNLREANLQDVCLFGANLAKVDLYRANLAGASLAGADLSGANFQEANLFEAYLHEANLHKAEFLGAYLFSAILTGANFRGASCSDANFTFANISKANLTGSDLVGATLAGAYLCEADLREANLCGTNFAQADLTGADLHAAKLAGTLFADTDLSSAKGLDSVHHGGPSTIGIDTMIRSKGNIPEVFLRGAGVPEPFIINRKALIAAMDPIHFSSCFISYSTKDQKFAERLHADLQAKGVRCWFAPHDARRGRKLHEQIEEAIRTYEKLLLVLSPHSMNSEWVKTEIAKARKRELREKIQVLFPLSLVPFKKIRDWECFDADTSKDSAKEIREYLIADFCKWKNQVAYQDEFTKLLRDLQTTRPAPTQTEQ